MLPSLFTERMHRLLGEQAALLETWQSTPLTTRGVRVNTLKCCAEQLCRLLPLSLKPTPFSPVGFVTETSFAAGRDPLHHAGAYYMQEPSAMSAVTLLSPQPGERVLDLCAAPGGKSTQIAAALGHTGLLWANEYVPARARVLAQNLERCGVRRAVVSVGDTARLAEALPAYFDAVLADVPCSGEGMFRKEPEAFSGWSEDNVRLCAARSEEILHNAAACVRPGGRLVVSTCTFAPEENEWAIIRFLHAHPDFTLEEAALPFGQAGFSAEQVASFGEAALLPFARTQPLSHTRRIFPWHGGEGHFLALLRRAGEGDTPYPRTVEAKPDSMAAEVYAQCFCEAPNGVFLRTGDTVRLIPSDLPEARGVHVLCAGVAVGEVIGGRTPRIEPCHAAFQSAAAADCRSLLNLTYNDPRLAAFLRGEELRDDAAGGWTGVAVEGVMCGFGKATGGRLKNRYPKGLRLLG
ncbi:MAG: hypothetical protein IKB04_04900 [Clostridia bacterium]|nr:hypothetical protein [Clostridia bacterium]